MSVAWWTKVNGPGLAQGDLIERCRMPVFAGGTDTEGVEEEIRRSRLIVITQSCDLENKKVEFVALCPIHLLPEFKEINPEFGKKGEWEKVRKGRYEALHLLASPENPKDNRSSLIVDFGHIISLPFDYLTGHAESLGNRWRLQSPFLEHFSQALARFFMRVGLPSTIPPFK